MHKARITLSLFLAAWAGLAAAGTPRIGASLGLAFPSDRLSNSGEPIGSKLLPAPGLGLIGAFDPSETLTKLSCEGSIEVNVFGSNDDKDLKVYYVPILFSGLWDIGAAAGLDMHVRAGAGGGFLSANSGSLKSLSGGAVSLGWRIGKELKGLSCAIDAGIDLLFKGGTQNMFRFKLLLFTR
jgi:hypothetical protein